VRILFGLLICSVCVIFSNETDAKVFRWANQGDAQTMDPHSQNEGVTTNINQHIYERLVDRDEKLQIVPSLAQRWQQIDPLTWRIYLRENVKFHDGALLTADDVLFSIERASHPNSQIAQYARALGKAFKVDDYTIDFRLIKSNPIFLQHMDFIFIMSKAWAAKNKVERPLDFKGKEETYAARNANGTGVFMLKLREPDVKTVLTRNPNHWNSSGVKSNVSEIIFTPIRSDATRTAALLSGDLDLLQDPAPQDLARLGTASTVKIWGGFENRIIFFGFDQFRDELLFSNVKGVNPFKDRRVRQAFYHAIDVESIRARIMRGQAFPTGCITPSPIACEMALEADKRLPFEPELSKKLLTDAGYPNGFELTMHCSNNRYVNDEEICLATAAMLSRIGIKTKLIAEQRSIYFSRLEKSEVSFYLLGWGGAITDAQTTLDPILHSREERTQKGYFNVGRFADSKLDELIDSSASEANQERRRTLIKEALLLHNQEVRHIPLHRQAISWASRSNIRVKQMADNFVRVWWANVD
jgi:peptide/nickel transport system substrate-binding protein